MLENVLNSRAVLLFNITSRAAPETSILLAYLNSLQNLQYSEVQ